MKKKLFVLVALAVLLLVNHRWFAVVRPPQTAPANEPPAALKPAEVVSRTAPAKLTHSPEA